MRSGGVVMFISGLKQMLMFSNSHVLAYKNECN